MGPLANTGEWAIARNDVQPCVLACDLGGSGLRLALMSPEGATLGAVAIPMSAGSPAPGWSEADPADWWCAFTAGAGMLAAGHPAAFAGVAAIAVTAMTRSQVLLDRNGQVLRPAILWADSRAADTLPALLDRLPPGHPETRYVNVFHPLARLWWLMRHEPACIGRLAAVIEPKDWLNLCLTGTVASDPVSMARLAAAPLGACGLNPAILPLLVAPTAPMGRVAAGHQGALAGLAGVPVLAMATDTWASVVGLGALRAGYAYNLSGTSEVLGLVGAHPVMAEGLMTVDWGGVSQLGGPSQAGGDTLDWVLALLGGLDDRGRALARAPRVAAPLLFLPYLQGERTPYWDASLRGAFIGLHRSHGPADLLHAVMQGVAFLNRIVLERATAAAGVPVSELRFGGGGAANAAWCQIKADVLGCDVVVPAGEEHGLAGAAMVAWTMLGRHPDLAAAQAALAPPERRYVPDPAARADSGALFALFRETEAALRPLSHRLAALA